MQTPIKVDQLLLTRIWDELSYGSKEGSHVGVYEEIDHAFVFVLPSNDQSVQRLGMLSQHEVDSLPEHASLNQSNHMIFIRHKYGNSWGPWLANEHGF